MRLAIVVVLLAACAQPLVPAATPATQATSATPRDDEQRDPQVDALASLLADPSHDRDGSARASLCRALMGSSDPRAVPLLLDVLATPVDRQPVAVHRAAATALGALGNEAAIDPLLTAMFRIPDIASTTSFNERVQVAIAAIGPAAVPRLVAMLNGEHEAVERAAAEAGADHAVVEIVAATMLGASMHTDAFAPLLAMHDSTSCRGGDDGIRRSVAARALGLIGDARAVPSLCKCLHGRLDPGTAFPTTEALALIGGDEATRCLVELVTTAEYDPDTIASAEFRYELRWESIRLAALAGGPAAGPAIESAIAANRDRTFRAHARGFVSMLSALRGCTDGGACLEQLLTDDTADRFAREVAAYAIARARRGDTAAAQLLARAWAIPDADVRTSIALLVRRMSPRFACPACAEAIAEVMERERGAMPAVMQRAVIEARATIAIVGAPGTDPFALTRSGGG